MEKKMIKVLQMFSGEQLICGIKENIDENNKGVGFEITHPYIIQLIPSTEINEQGQPASFNVNYVRWMSCSVQTVFNIPYSALVAIGQPDEQILETYMQKFGEFLNDDNTVQPSDSSDTAEDAGVSDSGD
jgi:hypothetical protein